jgi:HSP20 family protein
MAEAQKEKGTEIQKAMPARALSPFDEMERMLEGFLPRGWLAPLRWERPLWREMAAPFEGRWPRVDVVDRDEEVFIRAELPGVEKKDLDVSMGDGTVTIKASTKHEEKEEKGDYYRAETTQGAFARTVALPADVDSTRAKAKFKDGLLELTLPKAEKSKRRAINVE